ncbi:MAG TPA: DUF5661 family protein [Candidatus Nanopelagicales bacterium]|nr:DUF5661 family protein [Candidatus Nanopelagicales bacterium]
MPVRTTFDPSEALKVATRLGLDVAAEPFSLEEFRHGMEVELEHGRRDPSTNVTGDDPLTTGKIALAHLREIPDYYTRLARMEAEAEAAGAMDPA